MDGRELVERADDRPHPRDGDGPRVVEVVGVGQARSERLVERFDGEQLEQAAQGLRPLDEHVPERGRTVGRGGEHVGREPTAPGTGLDHDERVGLPEVAPHVVEVPRHERAEELPDLGTGDEVGPGAPGAVPRREEPALAVERLLDEHVERHRPLPVDPLDQT
ncbi:MAG: hypothetical protein U0W40_09090 [Acidimicrobiia bacterium]